MTADAKLLTETARFLEGIASLGGPLSGNAMEHARRLHEASSKYVGESRWIDAKVRVPCDGDIVLVGGFGYKGGFWSDAKYVDEEFLMFDQEADRYCWPCKRVLWWQPLPPLPPRDESPRDISSQPQKDEDPIGELIKERDRWV